jgi:TonB-linked SusC/RagA family outer membrane protein
MKKLLRTFFVCTLFLWLNTDQVFAQQKITGTVRDEKGIALPGVTVSLKGSLTGTQTGADGGFTLTVPLPATLTFSFVGYATQELAASSGTLNVVLKEQVGSLNEVVVVAFGKQKQATVTGSVSSIGGKELVSTSVSNVSNMLVGNIPGLSGVQASGEPGRNATKIYIRGISTTSGNTDPLVVIDGIQQAAERPFDQLNSMDANEIDNVTVLKDASSTAVYGIRGANGVIIVTTKRGRPGKPVFGLSSSFGVTQATNLLHNASSYQWALMRNEAICTEESTFGTSAFSTNLFSADDLWKMANNRDYTPEQVAGMTQLTDEQKAQLNASPALYYGSRDLFAEQFGGKGPQKQLNLTVSGGTSKVKYFTSLGYFNQGSIMNNTSYYGASTASKFDRINFRSNFDIEVIKNLTISVNLSGQFGTTSGPGYSNGANSPYDMNARYGAIMQYLFDSGPLTAPGLVEGKLVNSYAGVSGSPDNPLGNKLGSSKGPQNAIRNLLTSGREELYNTLLSNSLMLKYNLEAITPGLSLRATANYDDNYVKAVAYQPSLPEYTVRRNAANPNILDFYGGIVGTNTFDPEPPNGTGGHKYVWRKSYYDAGIDYARTFGDHNVTGLLLGTAQRYSIPGDSFNTPSGLVGFLGRTTYNFKERYLAEFTMGYNGTEQFIEGKRFGFFPAYSAGWVISNESFFPQNKWVSFFKVRASYGEVGNDRIGGNRYLYLPDSFTLNQNNNGYYFGNSDGSVVNPFYSGVIEGNIGNPAVTWERAKKKNLGIELRFLADRLAVTADIFQESRDNILTRLQTIPYTYGVATNSVPPVNVGKVTNHGYELVVNWRDKAGQFGYFVTGNLNYARNKVVFQAEAIRAYPWMSATGYAYNQYKGYLTDGFFNTQEELNNRPNNTINANQQALGDVRYKDINGDGLIDQKDIVPIGYSNVPQYTFSLKTGFTFKGFDVNVLFTGSAKGSFNLANYQMITPFFQKAGNVIQWQFDGRWTAEKVANGEKISYPRATIQGGTGKEANFLPSDLWIISSNYLRLKNIEVGYTLPQFDFLKRVHISSIRVYGNGNNLATWNSEMLKKGIDPEAQDGLSGRAVYPITQVFVFGAQLRF